MKVLFIGGTGVISSACAHLAVTRGMELCLFNRGQTSRPIPEEVESLQGDTRDRASVARALAGRWFDGHIPAGGPGVDLRRQSAGRVPPRFAGRLTIEKVSAAAWRFLARAV